MTTNQLKKLDQNLEALQKKLKDKERDGAAKDEALKELSFQLTLAREMVAWVQPETIEKLSKSLDRVAEMETSSKIASELGPVLREIASKDEISKLLPVLREIADRKDKEDVRVSNLSEIAPPEEIKVKGLGILATGLKSVLGAITGLKEHVFKGTVNGSVKVTNRELEDAIPVILASKDRRFFYDALVSILGSGGPVASDAKLDAILAAIQALDSDGVATSVGDGTATVATAGTAVQLASNSCIKVIVQAHESNAGTIVVGGSGVVAALVGRRGVALYPTQSQVFQVTNTNLLYIDSTENGDKVNFYYEVA